MIIPEDLTLEEYIGALKAGIGEPGLSVEAAFTLGGYLALAEVIKRELDKKKDKT